MSDFASLIFYITTFILSTILYKQYTKTKLKLFIILAFIIPLIIGGLRYNVGTDYMMYLYAHQHNIDIDLGFSIFSNVADLFNNFKILFILYNFFTLLFVFLGLENIKSKNRTLAYFAFLFLYYTTSFNAMRQMLAVAIVFYAFKFITEKNIIKFTITILFASIFHTTALFILALYPILISDNKKKKLLFLIILIICVVEYHDILTLISKIPMFSHFAIYNEIVLDDFSNKSFYFELLIYIYIFIHRNEIIEYDNKNSLYLYIYTIGLLISFVGFINPYVKRLAIYFLIPNISLLTTIPYLYKKKDNKFINFIMVYFLPIFKFIVLMYILKQSKIIPYNW